MFTPSSVQQQVFSLSWLINGAAANNWDQSTLQSHINDISSNIGSWQAVWGPAYFTPANKPVANAMFVAQGKDASGNPMYVVAIAGTNQTSVYDWMTEDMDITPLNWPYAQNQMQITTGDNTGLSNLLGLTSGGQSLQAFLHGISNKGNTTLWFTGHSLGGALSPLLTLALMDPNSTLNQSNNISLGNWSKVGLLATAGPSIGDQNFVTYFANTLYGKPQSLMSSTNSFVWNALDVVPHAWNAQTMQAITTPTNIYQLDLDSGSCLAQTLAAQQADAAKYSYQQFNSAPAFPLPGGLQSYASSPVWNAQGKFLAQAAYQHINAYVTAFQTTWFPTPENFCQEPVKAMEKLAEFNLAVCG